MTTEAIRRAILGRLREGTGQHRAGARPDETVVVVEDVDTREDVVLGYGLDDTLYGNRS